MKIATQEDVNEIYAKAFLDKRIVGRISTGTSTSVPKVGESPAWDNLCLINENKTALFRMTIYRDEANSTSIVGFSIDPNPIAIGRLIVKGMDYSLSWNPRDYTAMVLQSNTESMRVTRKLLGDPWGIEPNAGFDGLLGIWTGIAHFRKPNPLYRP